MSRVGIIANPAAGKDIREACSAVPKDAFDNRLAVAPHGARATLQALVETSQVPAASAEG